MSKRKPSKTKKPPRPTNHTTSKTGWSGRAQYDPRKG